MSIKLLQFAPDTFNTVLKYLKEQCRDLQLCNLVVEMIITRAWAQQNYTKLYASLISKLGNHSYPWAKGDNDEDRLTNG